MAINIGKLDDSREPNAVMNGFYPEGDTVAYETRIDVYDEVPSFPDDEAKRARCSQCLTKGVLGVLQSDFMIEGMVVPRADHEQIMRKRVECRGKGAIERALADEKCRITVAQYDREGNRINVYKPGYQTGN